jgi:hypothetical protein
VPVSAEGGSATASVDVTLQTRTRLEEVAAAAARQNNSLTGSNSEKQLVVVTEQYLARYREIERLRQAAEEAVRAKAEALLARDAFDAAPHWQEAAGLVVNAHHVDEEAERAAREAAAAQAAAEAAAQEAAELAAGYYATPRDSQGSFSYTDGSSYSYSESSEDEAERRGARRSGSNRDQASAPPTSRTAASHSRRSQPPSRRGGAGGTAGSTRASDASVADALAGGTGSVTSRRRQRRSAASGNVRVRHSVAGSARVSEASADRRRRPGKQQASDKPSPRLHPLHEHGGGGGDAEDVDEAPVPLDSQPIDDPTAIALRLWAGGDEVALQAAIAEQEALASGTAGVAGGDGNDADVEEGGSGVPAAVRMRRDSVAPPAATTELGRWLKERKLGRHELRMFQVGIRSISDLHHVIEADLDLLGFNYVERHRLWREMRAMEEEKKTAVVSRDGDTVPGFIADSGEEKAADGDVTVSGGVPVPSGVLEGVVRPLDAALDATALHHRKEAMLRADIVAWHDLVNAARQPNDYLRRTLGLTPFECRKLRTVLSVTTVGAAAGAGLAVRSPHEIDLPGFNVGGGYAAVASSRRVVTMVASDDSNSGDDDGGDDGGAAAAGGAGSRRSRKRGAVAGMNDALSAVLSMIGFGAVEAALRRMGVATVADLYRLTDADLELAGLIESDKLDFREALRIHKSREVRREKVAAGTWTEEDDKGLQVGLTRRERLDIVVERAELQLRRGWVWLSTVCWPRALVRLEPMLRRLRQCPCYRPPPVAPGVRRQDKWLQLRVFIQMTTPGERRVCGCAGVGVYVLGVRVRA